MSTPFGDISAFYPVPRTPTKDSDLLTWARDFTRAFQNTVRPVADRVNAMLQSGVLSNRPPPTGGRAFYFATDTKDLFYDDGIWEYVGGAALIAPGIVQPTVVSGPNGDITIGDGVSNVVLSGPGAPYSITGMVVTPTASLLGQIVIINNYTSIALTILNMAGGVAANSFHCPYGVNLVVPPYGMAIARYASGGPFWTIIATTPISSADALLASSTAISNTIAETAFSKSYALPAGVLNFPGAGLSWNVYGTISRTTSTNITIRAKLDGNIFFAAIEGLGNVTTLGWNLECGFRVRASGAGGTAMPAYGLVGMATQNATGNQKQPTTFAVDWTVSHTLTITAQWQAANAGDSIQIDDWSVGLLLPWGVTS